jgi:sugar transferase EpsL
MTPATRGEQRGRRGRDFVKRCGDAACAAMALLAFTPLLLLIALAIRFTMGAPVLFRQRRPGWRAKPFLMVKFRTMSDARDVTGRPLPDPQRLTRLGRFLRATSLDELPELWNVLRGEMSLVGPRPLLMEYLDRYTPEQARRHDVRPGLTGWTQVNGRNALSWDEKFVLDVWYVDHQSIRLDLKILALTVLAVLRREGISAAGHATMPEFTGSSTPATAGIRPLIERSPLGNPRQ